LGRGMNIKSPKMPAEVLVRDGPWASDLSSRRGSHRLENIRTAAQRSAPFGDGASIPWLRSGSFTPCLRIRVPSGAAVPPLPPGRRSLPPPDGLFGCNRSEAWGRAGGRRLRAIRLARPTRHSATPLETRVWECQALRGSRAGRLLVNLPESLARHVCVRQCCRAEFAEGVVAKCHRMISGPDGPLGTRRGNGLARTVAVGAIVSALGVDGVG